MTCLSADRVLRTEEDRVIEEIVTCLGEIHLRDGEVCSRRTCIIALSMFRDHERSLIERHEQESTEVVDARGQFVTRALRGVSALRTSNIPGGDE